MALSREYRLQQCVRACLKIHSRHLRALEGCPVFLDFIHKFFNPLYIYSIFKNTVIFKGSCTHCSIGNGQLSCDVIHITSGITKDRGVFDRSFYLAKNLGIAVRPDTQRASGRLLNSVDLAISFISLSARYLAASGTILKRSFKSFAPTAIL